MTKTIKSSLDLKTKNNEILKENWASLEKMKKKDLVRKSFLGIRSWGEGAKRVHSESASELIFLHATAPTLRFQKSAKGSKWINCSLD